MYSISNLSIIQNEAMPANALLEKASELLNAQQYNQLHQCFAAMKNPRFEKSKNVNKKLNNLLASQTLFYFNFLNQTAKSDKNVK